MTSKTSQYSKPFNIPFDFANPTGGPTLDPIPRKVGQGTGKSYINRPSGPAKHP